MSDANTHNAQPHPHAQIELPDTAERGSGDKRMDRRLFMQLLVYGGCDDIQEVKNAVTSLNAVVYQQWQNPTGVGILFMYENPDEFISKVHPVLKRDPFTKLTPKPEYTMCGRTYAIGHEPDLQKKLFDQPIHNATCKDWPWAVWYPLRRDGRFEALDKDKQREILIEHSKIGIAYGKADIAHDIRLNCIGLDKNDNDFVIGLVGERLVGLSAVVTAMRETVQTSLYVEKMGPFFVGKRV